MAIIGAILGDIGGSRWEFCKPKDLDCEHINLFTDDCFFTDDTVMTVATKYALQNNVSFKEAYHKFGNKYPNCSYGCGFESWLWSNNIFGNGAAMRYRPL